MPSPKAVVTFTVSFIIVAIISLFVYFFALSLGGVMGITLEVITLIITATLWVDLYKRYIGVGVGFFQ